MKYTTLSDDDMDVVQKFAFGGIANPVQRPFLRRADKEFLNARQAELDAFEEQRQAYNTALQDWQTNVYQPYQQQVGAYNTGLEQYKAEVFNPYQQQVDAYNTAAQQYNTEVYNPYRAQYDAYERALNEYNAGPRTSDYAGPAAPTLARNFDMTAPAAPTPFGMTAPTAPKDFDLSAPVLPFNQEEVQARQQAAAQTARKDAGNRALAIDVVSDPNRFNFGSMSVANRFMAKGGEVMKDQELIFTPLGSGPQTDSAQMLAQMPAQPVRQFAAGGPVTAAQIANTPGMGSQGIGVNIQRIPTTAAAAAANLGNTTSNANALTPEIATNLMQRSMTTGVPTAEFDRYGGYNAVAALYNKGGGTYSLDGIDKDTLKGLATQVANTGVGNLSVLSMAGVPLTAAGIAAMRRNGIDEANIAQFSKQFGPLAIRPVSTTGALPLELATRMPGGLSQSNLSGASQTGVSGYTGPQPGDFRSILSATPIGWDGRPATSRPSDNVATPGTTAPQGGSLTPSPVNLATNVPTFDYGSRGIGTAINQIAMPNMGPIGQARDYVSATNPNNYFAQTQPSTPGLTPGTTALAPIDMPLPGAINTLNTLGANSNLSPGMLGGQQNAGVMRDRLGNVIFSPGMPRFAKGGLAEVNAYNMSDEGDKDEPINTDPVGSAQQMLSQLTKSERPSPTRQSVKRVAKSVGGGETPKEMDFKVGSLTAPTAKDMVPELSNKGSSREQMEELARVYQLKINAAKNKARGLAADTFGAPTLEGPALTKNTLAKKRFAKGGEAKKSDAVEEGENLSSQQETTKGGFFGGLFGGNKEDPLKGIKKTAEKNKDYRAILEYLKSRDAVPEIKSGYLPDPIDAVFSSVNLPLVGAVGKGQIKINKEIRGPDYETFLGPSTLAHEMTHAADRQLQEQAGEQSGMFSKGNQFTDAYEKMVGSGGMREGKKRTELARKYYPKFVSGNRDYRAAPHEIAAHGVGKYAGPTTADDAPPHVDATAATEFQILLDLARRNSGTSVKKRAEGSPEEGEVSQAELEAASKPAFVTPKSGKGRKSSAKAGELEAAALQGISETPYNLLGAPVDLATMAMRPFGYNVQAPMLGSEDLKRRATKAGIRQEPPKEGTAARALYNLAEIGSSAVNPAAPVRAGMKAAKAVGDKATDVAKDFQQYNRQLDVPGASYAVRPTGSTMLTGPVGLEKNVSEVDQLLNKGRSGARGVAGQNVDQEDLITQFWDKKARNYFTRQFGTPDDPIAAAISKKQIKGSALEEVFPEYMLDQIAAGKTRVNEQGQERFFPKYPRAMEDFTKRYDQATGIKGNLITTNPAAADPGFNLISSEGRAMGRAAAETESDKMIGQGLRPELINPNVGAVTRSVKDTDRILSDGTESARGLLGAFEEASAYRKMTPEQQTEWANTQFGNGRRLNGMNEEEIGQNLLGENVRTAIEKGEPVYDIGYMGKPLSTLFKPDNINQYLASLPLRELANVRFEDAVRGGLKLGDNQLRLENIVERIKSGKPVADTVFSQGVSSPLLQFGEGSGLDGFAWKRIEKREATVPEGAYVGHSVGGYELGGATYTNDKRDGFNTGLWQVYTLRDNRNRPVNTIEVKMLDETTPVVTQIKGNGRATGNTAPEKYDGAVLRFLQEYLKPAAIEESNSYLTPLLQNYKMELGTSPRVR